MAQNDWIYRFCLVFHQILYLPLPSVQFSQYLHENAAYVRPLEDGLLQLHQSITEDTVTMLVSDVCLLFFYRHMQ